MSAGRGDHKRQSSRNCGTRCRAGRAAQPCQRCRVHVSTHAAAIQSSPCRWQCRRRQSPTAGGRGTAIIYAQPSCYCSGPRVRIFSRSRGAGRHVIGSHHSGRQRLRAAHVADIAGRHKRHRRDAVVGSEEARGRRCSSRAAEEWRGGAWRQRRAGFESSSQSRPTGRYGRKDSRRNQSEQQPNTSAGFSRQLSVRQSTINTQRTATGIAIQSREASRHTDAGPAIAEFPSDGAWYKTADSVGAICRHWRRSMAGGTKQQAVAAVARTWGVGGRDRRSWGRHWRQEEVPMHVLRHLPFDQVLPEEPHQRRSHTLACLPVRPVRALLLLRRRGAHPQAAQPLARREEAPLLGVLGNVPAADRTSQAHPEEALRHACISDDDGVVQARTWRGAAPCVGHELVYAWWWLVVSHERVGACLLHRVVRGWIWVKMVWGEFRLYSETIPVTAVFRRHNNGYRQSQYASAVWALWCCMRYSLCCGDIVLCYIIRNNVTYYRVAHEKNGPLATINENGAEYFTS